MSDGAWFKTVAKTPGRCARCGIELDWEPPIVGATCICGDCADDVLPSVESLVAEIGRNIH